jgi:hypothetical protein
MKKKYQAPMTLLGLGIEQESEKNSKLLSGYLVDN